MKKTCSTLIVSIALSSSVLLLSSCENKNGSTVPSSGKTTSAEKTSFKEVTSKLDAGGGFYLYLSTEQILQGLSGKLDNWRNTLTSLPDTQKERDQVGHVFDVVSDLIKNSGLEEISGFGMSSIATEPGFYRSKTLLHHYPGKGDGYLWKMFGEKPHDLNGLDLLPTTTAITVFSDGDLPLLWSVVEKESAQTGIPEVQQGLAELKRNFERGTGLKWDDVLASLGGEYGFVMTLDDSKMVPVPIPGQQMQVPEPGLMIVAKVKNDTIFDRIDAQLAKQAGEMVVKTDTKDLKMRTVPVPLPLPIQLRPSIATSGGYLFIASSDAMIQEALAVKSGQKPGLKSTDEFKHLSKDIPQQGNQFCFLSQRFGKTIVELQRQSLNLTAGKDPARKQLLEALLQPDKAGFAYSVSLNTEEGWMTIGNGNQEPGKAVVAMTAVVPAMLAAIAVPNFVKARQTAQKNACINNLRQIDGAKQQWALEHNKKGTDTPTQADLLPYLTRQMWPQCPQGGHYTIGRVDEMPRCSIPGHSMNN